MKKIFIISCSFFLIGLFLSSCSSDSSSAGVSADRPSTVMGSVGTAVAKAGTSLGGSRGGLNTYGRGPLFVSTNCDEHAEPKVSGSSLSSSDGRYPGLSAYCKMAINTEAPDSVQGAFSMPRSLSCALEKAGITWDGAPHTVTMTLDSSCFSAAQLNEMPGSMQVTVTASSPATNSHFDRSVQLDVPNFGTYTFMTKVSSSQVEFIAMENQDAVSGGTKQGVFAGYLNLDTGVLRYEARMDRMNCSNKLRDCGWNRHIRVYADLTMSGGSPTGLESMAMAYSNIQNPASGGTIFTAVGDLTSGIKGRAWNITAASVSDYNTAGNWTESNTSGHCHTADSDTAGTCGLGQDMFSGTSSAFTLNNASGYTTCSTFMTNYAGMSFTTVALTDGVSR